MSNAMTRLLRRLCGTSLWTIRRASPSAIAVFPTPGCPIRTGLFLLRRESTWMTRRISSSRPITGSSFPAAAAATRSMQNFSSDWYFASGFWSVTRALPRTCWRAFWTDLSSTALANSKRFAGASIVVRASNRCSVDTNSSLIDPADFAAVSNTCCKLRLTEGWLALLDEGKRSTSDSTVDVNWDRALPILSITAGTMPPASLRRASSRWSGAISAWPFPPASVCALATAAWALVVSFSN